MIQRKEFILQNCNSRIVLNVKKEIGRFWKSIIVKYANTIIDFIPISSINGLHRYICRIRQIQIRKFQMTQRS